MLVLPMSIAAIAAALRMIELDRKEQAKEKDAAH
jgi:hypothetical protein